MKLLRVGTAGAETPALLDAEGVLRDLGGVVADIDGALDRFRPGRMREAVAASGQLARCLHDADYPERHSNDRYPPPHPPLGPEAAAPARGAP